MTQQHTLPSAPRLLLAQYDATCWTCAQPISKGATIHYLRNAGPLSKLGRPLSVVWHEACPAPAQPYTPPAEADSQRVHEDQAQAPVTQRTAPTGDSLADALAHALQGRLAPQIDPQQVRRLAAEEIAARVQPMLSHALAQLPTQDPAQLAKQAAAEALRAVQATISAATAAGGAPAIVGEIPQADPDFHATGEAFETVSAALERDAHVLVSGPSGSGKTYVLEQVCAREQRRLVTVSCADGLTYGALVCATTLEQQAGATVTRSRYGALPLAMRAGAVLLVDEADQLVPELAAILHAVMEPDPRRRRLSIPETGETIHAEPGFVVALTCNGLRDVTGAYHGHRLSGAILTRTWHAAADYLAPIEEAKLLEKIGAGAVLARTLAAAMGQIRERHLANEITTPPSTRTAVQIVRAMLGQHPDGTPGLKPMPWLRAWQALYVGSLSSNEAKAVAPMLAAGDAALKSK